MKRFILRRLLPALGLLVLLVFVLNTNLLAPESTARPQLIAHRGLGQTFWREGLQRDTCTANRIHEPQHPYLENTLQGFKAAFDAGADVVEFDVHPTTDGDFVVFHDWTVDCRTNGTGITRKQSLAYLRTLDIGHGYTADGGKTFPFRGKGVGMMPTLAEVLAAFPGRRFLVNIKSDDVEEGRRLGAVIARLPREQRDLISVYGGGRAIDAYKQLVPDARVLRTDGAVRCFLRYVALGWSTYVPQDCRGTLFMVPVNFAPFMWGYPHRLAARMQKHDSTLVMLGPNNWERYTTGVDDAATHARLPAQFNGGIWTNRVDLIAPLVRR